MFVTPEGRFIYSEDTLAELLAEKGVIDCWRHQREYLLHLLPSTFDEDEALVRQDRRSCERSDDLEEQLAACEEENDNLQRELAEAKRALEAAKSVRDDEAR